MKRTVSHCAALLCALTLALSSCRPLAPGDDTALPAAPPAAQTQALAGSNSAVVDGASEPTDALATGSPRIESDRPGNPQPVEEMPAREPAIMYAVDFAIERQDLGWKAEHDLARFSFNEEGLHSASTGGDPYMVGPRIELDPQSALHLDVRMRSSLGADAQFFWEVDGHPFNEGASQHFEVKPDGEWHTYRLDLKSHALWTGTITRLRLDPSNLSGADLSIAWIRAIGLLPPNLQVVQFGPAAGIQAANRPFRLCAGLTNTGDESGQNIPLRLELPDELSIDEGAVETTLETLPPGETVRRTWQVRGPAGIYPVSLWAGNSKLKQTDLLVETGQPSETIELKGEVIRLQFERQPYGYGAGTVQWKDGPAWKTAGRLRSLGRIVFLDENDQVHEKLLFADQAGITTENGDRLSFLVTYTDPDGAAWTHNVTFEAEAGKPWFRISLALGVDRPARLLSWSGPDYLAGEASFGKERTTGMFPGLEYLAADEQSSGTDYAGPAVARRYIPHPNKITIPFMSVGHEGLATGLLWDPLQITIAEHNRPAALYASPNTWDGQSNHLMRLFFPGISAGLAENQDKPETPFRLEAGQWIKLDQALFAAPSRDPLSPLEVWLDYSRFSPAEKPIEWPRTIDEELTLCLSSYSGVTWAPESNGWHYTLHDPWGPGSNPAVALHLWTSTLGSPADDAARLERRSMVGQSLSRPAAGGQPNTWFYQPALALHMAQSPAEINRLLDIPLDMAGKQKPDGSWSYSGSGGNVQFGQAGDTSNGYSATFAFPVLYYARLSGNPRLVEAGLKALAYLESQPLRPEGAQTWELSLHVPDLLASAWIIQSYVEGYRLTGETRYLDQAQRWALAGLPFIYLWSPPDRPIMRYTTIPVFGATNFTYPWFGRPVMWNGLDYAFGLQALDESLAIAGIEPEFDWRGLAKGISAATAQMQPEEGSFQGMYPDAWDVTTGMEAYSWWLSPTYLMQNLLLLNGDRSATVQTQRIEVQDRQVRINAPAEILNLQTEGSRIRLRVKYYPGETLAVWFSGIDRAPEQVRVNGIAVLNGWETPAASWALGNNLLLVKVPFGQGSEADVEVVISP